MYEASGEERILTVARRAADWIVDTFSGDGVCRILEATNLGSQHISCFYAMCYASKVTGDRKYLDFISDILDYCETTDMNLLSFKDILSLRSKKGIEMLVIYLGVLTYGRMTGNIRATDAARRYFDGVINTQIRNTGNGTVKESWTENGNAPMLMATEEKPNETCVAVGIVELALALFDTYGDAKYLDVIEKTLFNHLLGSLDKNGSDFAYYQGNYGKKIFRTEGGMYQCCRYRGFTLFSYLNDCLYALCDGVLTPMIYAPSTFAIDGVECRVFTEYPVSGDILFELNTAYSLKLRLRIPSWCKSFSVELDGVRQELIPNNGYIEIPLEAGASKVRLKLDVTLIRHGHNIDGKPYCSFTYGPLLLAHDTHFGGELWQAVSADEIFAPKEAHGSIVAYGSKVMTLVDFASAGSNEPSADLYTVYMPFDEE